MANLRDFLYGFGESEEIEPKDFAVFNTSIDNPDNGGQCCLWCVPEGTRFAIFEMWSGGGSGPGACCAYMGGPAGSGGYAVKACQVSPGQQIRLCAAGSGCCRGGSYTCGTAGCDTWVCSLGGGGESTWCSSVSGGSNATVPATDYSYRNCYTCCSMCHCYNGCGTGANVDINIPGTGSSVRRTQYCDDDAIQFAANAPFIPGPALGVSGCRCSYGTNAGFGIFPGGGGKSAVLDCNTYDCICGGPGAGGLIYVIYF